MRQKKYVIAFSQTGGGPDSTCDLVTDCVNSWIDENDDIEIVQVIPQMTPVPQMILIGNTVYGTQYNYTVTILYIDHDENLLEKDMPNASTTKS